MSLPLILAAQLDPTRMAKMSNVLISTEYFDTNINSNTFYLIFFNLLKIILLNCAETYVISIDLKHCFSFKEQNTTDHRLATNI